MVSVVVFEFSGMRCQPLRRALTSRSQKWIELSFLMLLLLKFFIEV
ncbi:acetyltransferase [Vibrio cholerae]|nr:acetyltransferase [Vibrio cholerae]